MKKIETSGTVIEQAMQTEADRGLRVSDLPTPATVHWRNVLRAGDVFDKADLTRIREFRGRFAELSQEIDESNHETVVRQFYADLATARNDSGARAALETKSEMLGRAKLKRSAAKQERGALDAQLAKDLLPVAQRLLLLCERELVTLRDAEDKLSSRYGAPSHKSPLSWALGRSLAPLHEALARGAAPLALLERYVGQVETK